MWPVRGGRLAPRRSHLSDAPNFLGAGGKGFAVPVFLLKEQAVQRAVFALENSAPRAVINFPGMLWIMQSALYSVGQKIRRLHRKNMLVIGEGDGGEKVRVFALT